jgi:hypothetical protein
VLIQARELSLRQQLQKSIGPGHPRAYRRH